MSLPFFLESVALPIVSTFGLLGNILSIIVLFLRKSNLSRHSNFTSLLIFLAIVDSLFLLLLNLLYVWPQMNSSLLLATPYLYPLVHMAMSCSVYTVVAITVERYATIRQYRSKLFTARYLIIFIITFSICFNFIKFFELYIERSKQEFTFVRSDDSDLPEEKLNIEVKPTWLRTDTVYSLVYIVSLNFIFMSFIPFVALSVLNFSIFKSYRRMSQNYSDTTMAGFLFSIVIIFLCCHSIRFGLNVYEGSQMVYYGTILKWNWLCDLLAKCSQLLLAINSSVNIIIYTAKDIKFRQSLFLIMRCRRGQSAAATIDVDNMTTVVTKDVNISE